MLEFLQEWGLTLAIFLPLVGVAAMMAFPKSDEATHKVIALGTSLVVAAIGVALLFDFDFDRADEMQWAVSHDWIDIIRTQYSIQLSEHAVRVLMSFKHMGQQNDIDGLTGNRQIIRLHDDIGLQSLRTVDDRRAFRPCELAEMPAAPGPDLQILVAEDTLQCQSHPLRLLP